MKLAHKQQEQKGVAGIIRQTTSLTLKQKWEYEMLKITQKQKVY